MNHLHRLTSILILLTIIIAAPTATAINAQQDMAACPAITLQALEATKQLCEGAANNEVCYGHIMLEAEPQPNVGFFKFDTEGDIASVSDMASLRLSAMDTTSSLWGVALMRLQVNLLNQAKRESVMLLLFGDVEITNYAEDVPSVTFPATVKTDGSNAKVRSTPGGARIAALADGAEVTATGRTEDGEWVRIVLDNERSAWIATFLLRADEAFDSLDVVKPNSAVYAPMQAFYMKSGVNDAACPEAPNSGLMIQTPEGVAQITFLINEVDIQLGSTVFFQANPGQELTVSVIEGSASVTADGVTRKATTGSQISVPLDENGAASDVPSLPRAYDWASVMALPAAYMDEPVPVAEPISAADLAFLIDSQLNPTEEPVVELDENGDPVVVLDENGDPVVVDPDDPDAPVDVGLTPGAPPTEEPPVEPTPETVLICHNGKEKWVNIQALQAFLDQGATLGPCPTPEP